MRSNEFIKPKHHGELEKKSFKMSTLGGSDIDQKPMTANEITAQKKQKPIKTAK